jgi:hypothetical protein
MMEFNNNASTIKYFQDLEITKILELDSAIVQISLSPMGTELETKLLVSTETRTIVCDYVKQNFVEVGNQPR